MSMLSTFETIATVLEYPTADTPGAVRGLFRAVEGRQGSLAAPLSALARLFDEEGVARCEERYTRLFDLKPACTLNLAWHIFGDTYDRGALLALLVPELEAAGIAYEHDLPDYLPTLLRLLARLPTEEDRQLLAHALLVPGLEKMRKVLAEATDPWSQLLAALPDLILDEVPKGSTVDIPAPRRTLEVVQSC